ncbi:universal stress protein [Paucibacter sp. O1-1]|uniref:universal stress protein n=1 Tax=Paucibacter sp. M5-1 TaxID=3015998 RepID=UPI0021D4EDC8|nr:universal stress protein [Paucibacter sp. M5-1]MCU7372159.1 universal stress protein [Paucibacter sp. O1-1]MCZ7880637.1 universal stress protein [Paucibacter sp. M5-1]MDA3827149.1 universal stress protein [Paucibacter sp. O1-1]
MSYRSLLVHLDQTPQCTERSRQAIALAQRMECHLVGLAPTGLLNFPVVPEAGAALAEFNTMAWELLQQQADQAAALFRAACAAAGLRSCEVIVDPADTASSLVRHAHCSDLLLMSQPDPDRPGHTQARAVLEQVLLHSARPTLLLPYAASFKTLGQRALVAWDDSREAARALNDALPLLRQAQSVQLLSWRESLEDEDLRPRLAALQQWLAWQGVAAEAREERSEIGVAEALLSRATDQDADLIVMGAYGHSRWTELVLGGATRGLLDAMTVPVLMSH